MIFKKELSSFKILLKADHLKSILSNLSWLFIEKMVRYSIGLIVGVWIARYFGPANFGIYSYALAFTALFGVLPKLGLKDIATKEVINNQKDENAIIGTSLFLMLFSGIITFAIAVLTVKIFKSDDYQTIMLVSIISVGFIFQPYLAFTYYLDSKVKSKYHVIASVFAFIICSLLKVFAILNESPLTTFAIILTLELFINFLILIFVINRMFFPVFLLRWNSSYAIKMLKESYPLILSGFMIMIYMKMDQIMIRDMVSDQEAGLYAAAVRFTEIFYFIPIIVQTSVFPNLLKAMEISKELFISKLTKLFSMIIMFSIGVAVFMNIISTFIIEFLYGVEYSASIAMLNLLIWVFVFVAIGVIRSIYIVAFQLTKIHMWTVFYGLLINLVLNFILIPRYGGIGAIYSTFCAQIVAAYVSSFWFRETREVGIIISKSFILIPRIIFKRITT